jgi:hypothetical protein
MLQWKNNNYYIFSVCVFNLSYLACKFHARCYIVIGGLSVLTIIFPHYFTNGTIFEEKKY